MKEDIILDAPESKSHKYRLLGIIIWALMGLVAIGFVFKWMHWPGGGALIFFPSILLVVLLTYRFFITKEREFSDYFVLAAIGVWIVYLYSAYLSKMF